MLLMMMAILFVFFLYMNILVLKWIEKKEMKWKIASFFHIPKMAWHPFIHRLIFKCPFHFCCHVPIFFPVFHKYFEHNSGWNWARIISFLFLLFFFFACWTELQWLNDNFFLVKIKKNLIFKFFIPIHIPISKWNQP